MKNIYESAETFEAAALIAFGYYELKKISSEDNKRSAIEMMIDEVTGYGAFKTKEAAQQAIEIIKIIIENKKILGADYSADEMAIKSIKELM